MIDASVFGELADARRWVAWRWENRNGKPTKPPIDPATGTYARNNDPTTWGTFEDALYCRDERGLDGVGIELGDGLGGIDLDGCREPETGALAPWAGRIVDSFRSYAEVSPSGTGVKILAFGAPDSLPASTIPVQSAPINGKRPAIEAFTRGRYFTVTGEILPESPNEIRDCGDTGDAWDRMVRLLLEHTGHNGDGRGNGNAVPAGGGLPDDVRELLGAISADCSHDEWLRVGMALHRADPVAGLDLWDRWSATAPERYPGQEEIGRRWESFHADRAVVVTIGTLRHKAMERGYRPRARTHAAEAPDSDDLQGPTGPDATTAEGTFTDAGNAARLVMLHGERLHYAPPWRKWLVFQQERGTWILDSGDVLIRELAKDVGIGLKQDAVHETDKDNAEKLLKFAFRSLNAHGISGMVDLARGIDGIPLDHERLDRDEWLLGVENGVIDLRAGNLRGADPADLMTMQCPVRYDPSATAPRFKKAMEEWFPDEELRTYVQRIAGAALVGAQRDHVFIIHYGGGRNGKGTFVRALQRVLGRYAVVIHLSLLVVQKYSQHDTIRAELFRARLAVASETQRRVRLDEASVKNLTGGDRITARRMREDPWEFDPTHSLWLQTNHLPEIAGRDRGIWSRIRVVKWVSTFEGKEERGLDDKLTAEAQGILAWLVQGCLEWQKHGLTEPEAVIRETLAYREAEDTFSRFATEMGLVFRADLEIQAGELQRLLAEWADTEGIVAPRQEVATWLHEHDATQRRKKWKDDGGKRRQARFWTGIGVADAAGDGGDGVSV